GDGVGQFGGLFAVGNLDGDNADAIARLASLIGVLGGVFKSCRVPLLLRETHAEDLRNRRLKASWQKEVIDGGCGECTEHYFSTGLSPCLNDPRRRGLRRAAARTHV